MPSEWLTYAAAGERLGLRPESIRQKAFRNHWPKRLGNDGFAQVKIDIAETLAAAPPRRPRSGLVAAERLRQDTRRDTPEAETPLAAEPDHAHVVATLHARIVDLQAELMQLHVDRERERAELQADVADARQDRDRERSRADIERAHVERLTDEIATLARALADAAAGSREGAWRWPAWVERLVHRSAVA